MERLDMSNGRLGLSSVESLYSYIQKVYVKTYKGEEKVKMLKIILEIKTEIAMSLGKVLSLQITDDNDCSFYYSLMLTHEDFTILKSQQGLLVDFDHFPSQLIKLFELCRCQDVTNKFILVLDEEDIMVVKNALPIENNGNCIFLKVIETNNFKNLCHLSMKVRKGSDADIKNHMSLKIANLTEKLREETKKYKASEINLNEALKALDAKTKELTELQLKVAEEKNNLKLETSHQISEEREKMTKLQIDWQQRLEMEKSHLIIQHQKQLQELNEQINLLTFNNKNLYENKCQLDTSVKEKNFRVEALEKQIMQLSQEISLLKKQNGQLDQDYHEKDKMVLGLKTRLAAVEQELKDKVKFLEKQQELFKAANDQKNFFEEALNEKEIQLQKKQGAVQTLSTDLMKYNDVIGKLQAELNASKAKMKLRTDIALEQEKVLEKKCQELASKAQTIDELNEKLSKVTQELIEIKAQLEVATKKLEEKELTIKKNDNVISWLNRRLTESTILPNNGSSSKTANLTLSSRIEKECPVLQPKGNISNLAKNWPPWLLHSMVGPNSSQSDSAGLSNSSNFQIQISADYPSGSKQPSKLDEYNMKKETEDISGVENKSETEKLQGLDPKYFQSSLDRDLVPNSQILKVYVKATDDPKLNSTNSSGKEKKQISAYFPKKTVAL